MLRIQADFIVVDPWRVVPQGVICIQAGRIQSVGSPQGDCIDIQLPGQTLLPGFINAHTHLDLSDFSEPIPAQGSFTDWIAAVIQHRRQQQRAQDPSDCMATKIRTIARGLGECVSSGTAAIVDIVTPPWDAIQLATGWNDYKLSIHQGEQQESHPQVDHDLIEHASRALCQEPSVIALPEILGLDEERFQQMLSWAVEIQSQSMPVTVSPLVEVGYSPHATYSVDKQLLLEHMSKLNKQAIAAVHIAESLEELQWLHNGTGAFQELYQRIGLPIDRPRWQVDQAITMLAQFRAGLLIHGNYLSDQQLDLISNSGIAVVYCPRTHQHFNHSPYPLKKILERQIPLLLGTDSRASNPDLSLWKECFQAKLNHSDCSATEIFASVTTAPARILGLDCDLGSLTPGRKAWVNSIATPASATSENLLEKLMIQESWGSPQPLINYLRASC